MRVFFSILFLCLTVTGLPAEASPQGHAARILSLSPKNCVPGLHHQPGGPFALITFCEDGAGTYIAVSCYDPGICQKAQYPDGRMRFSGWQLDKRFWQQSPWSENVTSAAWGPKGKYLYIATSEIYGSGGLFQLDLENRRFRQLRPAERQVNNRHPGPDYKILGFTSDGHRLRFSVRGGAEQTIAIP